MHGNMEHLLLLALHACCRASPAESETHDSRRNSDIDSLASAHAPSISDTTHLPLPSALHPRRSGQQSSLGACPSCMSHTRRTPLLLFNWHHTSHARQTRARVLGKLISVTALLKLSIAHPAKIIWSARQGDPDHPTLAYSQQPPDNPLKRRRSLEICFTERKLNASKFKR